MTFSFLSGTEYDFVITAMTGTEGHMEMALAMVLMVSGKSFREVPSTQHQMTLIRDPSLPSAALSFDHFRTERTALAAFR